MNPFDWTAKWALYTPSRLALRDYPRQLEWTYKEFDERINNLVAYLQNTIGLKKGDRIAVLSRNRAEYVFLFFACMKAGWILVPLNFRLMPLELDVLLTDAAPTVLFFEDEFAGYLPEINAVKNIANQKNINEVSNLITAENSETIPTECVIEENDVVMILYTAGTTGLPKGAMITPKMLFWNSINTSLRLDLTSADHTQSYAPFFHTGGWNVLLTPFIHHGASHTLLDGFEPDLILKLIAEEKTTLLFGVPTMLQMLADSDLFEKTDFSSVRYAIVGGAPMPKPLIDLWHSKGVFIRQGYGLTEVGPNCFSLHQDDAIRKKGSIGFPNFYIDTKVVNEKGSECNANEVGELWLQSPVVTPGYWKKPDETKKAITDGWFHTGDMVQYDDEGFFYVVDRKKNMFISGGENVYPAEVEKFLYTHPDIKEVAVIGIPDEKWGEVGHGFIALKDDEKLSENDLKNYCKGKLAKYKTPKYFSFLKELPKNAAGKIDRKQLINTTI
ncbi:MAG: long-chain fatty acid--CoA ligase [Calditrichae bacterium]|nr:long-chain fatty acid--CoA ligase [Calditrichia bacterium]